MLATTETLPVALVSVFDGHAYLNFKRAQGLVDKALRDIQKIPGCARRRSCLLPQARRGRHPSGWPWTLE
jgi:hypothetical protein